MLGKMVKVAAGLTALVLISSTVYAGGTLKIGRDQDSTTMDPILMTQNADVWVVNNINALLVRNAKDATGVEPDLAEKWTISDDGLVYRFTLRDNIKFSNGEPVTTKDVLFSLDRLMNDKRSVFGSLYSVVSKVEAPDDKTIVITLKEKTTPFITYMGLFAAAILPADYVKNHYDTFLEKPVGAGAFRLTEWKRGVKIVMIKSPYYWEEGLPKLDQVEWHYVPDDTTRILKLQAGELDSIIFVPFNRIASLKKDKNINVLLEKSSRMDHILINHTHAPLDNVKVRQALNLGIDVDAVVQAVTFGYGTVANSYIPAGGMYYNKDNPKYGYDPEKAKALLEEAGVKDLELKYVVQSGDANYEQIAVIIQDQLAKIGVTVNIEKQETGQAWETIVDGEYDLNSNYWTNDIIDPAQKTGFVLYGVEKDTLSYYTRYNNPEVNKLIENTLVESDAAKRKALYYQIQEQAFNDAHWINLYYSPFRNAARKNVKGFFQNPMGRFFLEETTVE